LLLLFFRLNCEENYNYDAEPPDVEDYFLFMDTESQINEKKLFYLTLTDTYFKWNFKEQLFASVSNEAFILLQTCTKFLYSCFSLQEKIKSVLKITDKKFIHPFEKRLSSISGYTYKVCNLYFLKNYVFSKVNFEYSGNFVKTSRGELEFASFKEFTEPQKHWISYFNNPDGQKSFKNYKVDLWSPLGEIYQFYGCEFHYHLPPECSLNVGKNDKSKNCKNVSFLELKMRDEKAKNELLQKFSGEVLSFKTMFECE